VGGEKKSAKHHPKKEKKGVSVELSVERKEWKWGQMGDASQWGRDAAQKLKDLKTTGEKGRLQGGSVVLGGEPREGRLETNGSDGYTKTRETLISRGRRCKERKKKDRS